jgi:hypothetical protein
MIYLILAGAILGLIMFTSTGSGALAIGAWVAVALILEALEAWDKS